MKHIHKCMDSMVPNTMQLIPCYICIQLKYKYIEIYNEFISQLRIYAKAVRILAKGYLPILLVTPLKLQEILDSVKETLIKTNPVYDMWLKDYTYIMIWNWLLLELIRKESLSFNSWFLCSPMLNSH